jgi:hypothetical protein
MFSEEHKEETLLLYSTTTPDQTHVVQKRSLQNSKLLWETVLFDPTLTQLELPATAITPRALQALVLAWDHLQGHDILPLPKPLPHQVSFRTLVFEVLRVSAAQTYQQWLVASQTTPSTDLYQWMDHVFHTGGVQLVKEVYIATDYLGMSGLYHFIAAYIGSLLQHKTIEEIQALWGSTKAYEAEQGTKRSSSTTTVAAGPSAAQNTEEPSLKKRKNE